MSQDKILQLSAGPSTSTKSVSPFENFGMAYTDSAVKELIVRCTDSDCRGWNRLPCANAKNSRERNSRRKLKEGEQEAVSFLRVSKFDESEFCLSFSYFPQSDSLLASLVSLGRPAIAFS